MATPTENSNSEADHFLGPYLEHTKTLRGWYVGYGIGAPVVFISQPSIWSKVSKVGFGKSVLLYFLIGTSIQVILALINKYTNRASYYTEMNPKYNDYKIFKWFAWYSERFEFDLAVDIFSLFFFGRATWLVFKAFIYLP